MQYGDVKEELEQFQQQRGLMIYQDEEIDSLQNLDDFAAQVSALDLIVSTSNTTVHMAGALGKQVWTLLALYTRLALDAKARGYTMVF